MKNFKIGDQRHTRYSGISVWHMRVDESEIELIEEGG